MEVIQIIKNEILGSNQLQNQFLSGSSTPRTLNQQQQILQSFVASLEENNNELIVPQQPQQYYFVNYMDGCSFLSILDGDNLALLTTPDDDDIDDEVPPWKLDHMYAKKPKEPGSEPVKAKTRRPKKKEITNKIFLQEIINEPPPKINIIRQRHVMNGYNRPKILTPSSSLSSKFYTNNFCSSANTNTSCTYTTSKTQSLKAKPKIFNNNNDNHNDLIVDDESSVVVKYEEYNAPSPGAVVTVCDGEAEEDAAIVSSPTINAFPSQIILENRHPSLDSIDDDDVPDSELFFDFSIEESEVEGNTIDVDFNEIPLPPTSTNTANANSNNEDTATLSSFLNNSAVENHEIIIHENPDNSHNGNSSTLLESFVNISDTNSTNTTVTIPNLLTSLPSWDALSNSSHTSSNNNDNISCIHNNDNHSTNNVNTPIVRKRGRPAKRKSDSSSPSTTNYSNNFKGNVSQNSSQYITHSRRSNRPIKAPSRLEDIEDSPKRKRRYEYRGINHM